MNTNKPGSDQSMEAAEAGLEANLEANLDEANLEANLDQVLRNFRSSVHAWSEAELRRPRMVPAAHRHSWRFAAAWALGCVVAVGSVTAGLYQHHRSEMQASNSQQMQQPPVQQDQEQFRAPQTAASEQARHHDENLMAVVDSDVSRPVPSAMEPLAQLMDESPDQ